MCVHRKTQHARAQLFSVGALDGAGGETKTLKRLLPVKRKRIVNRGWNVLRQQMLPQGVAIRSGNDKQVVVALAGFLLSCEGHFGKRGAIHCGDFAPSPVRSIEPLQLHAQNGSLQLIEPAVVSQDLRRRSSRAARSSE